MKNLTSVKYKGAQKVEKGIKDKLNLWDIVRHKFLTRYFFIRFTAAILKYILLVGLCFLILYPMFVRVTTSIMSADDFRDAMVRFIPRSPTFYNFRRVIEHSNYWQALLNTVFVSGMGGAVQMFICASVGYVLPVSSLRADAWSWHWCL
jgi:multiple sugar transport system permease protein